MKGRIALQIRGRGVWDTKALCESMLKSYELVNLKQNQKFSREWSRFADDEGSRNWRVS